MPPAHEGAGAGAFDACFSSCARTANSLCGRRTWTTICRTVPGPPQPQRHLDAGLAPSPDAPVELRHAAHLLAADVDDEIARFDAGVGRWSAPSGH